MSRYAEVHLVEKRKGPGDARPTGLDIVRDEKREGDLVGKVVVITGCSSGIGPPTVEAMAATGATVYATARDLDKARKALGAKLLDSGRVHVVYMDQTSLASVKACAEEIRQHEPAIHILINNAGVAAVPDRRVTEDGFELQMGTNHLSHFYFFCLLRERLLAGSSAAFASRVINISSTGHRWAQLDLDNMQLAKPGSYSGAAAYGMSKTANVYMANYIDRHYGNSTAKAQIHANSVMPGGIVTPLQRHMPADGNMDKLLSDPDVAAFMKSPEQGCATTIFGAVARELEGKGGMYLEDCQISAPAAEMPKMNPMIDGGYEPWAFDVEKEEALWKASLKLVGLPEDF